MKLSGEFVFWKDAKKTWLNLKSKGIYLKKKKNNKWQIGRAHVWTPVTS